MNSKKKQIARNIHNTKHNKQAAILKSSPQQSNIPELLQNKLQPLLRRAHGLLFYFSNVDESYQRETEKSQMSFNLKNSVSNNYIFIKNK